MKSHLRLQKKILAFGLAPEAIEKLQAVLRLSGVTVVPVSRASASLPLFRIVDTPEEAPAEAFEESLLLFADFDRKSLHETLNRLEKEHFSADYRAVITPTNRDWLPDRLFDTLREEKKALDSIRKNKESET